MKTKDKTVQQITLVSVDVLIPYARNSRTHSQEHGGGATPTQTLQLHDNAAVG